MKLRDFSNKNFHRCTTGFGHRLDSWSIAEWTNAIAGEAGEACNIAKKMLRHRDKLPGNVKEEDKEIQLLKAKLAREIADTVVYADLAMQALGYNLDDVLKEVFNDKSDQIGCDIKL